MTGVQTCALPISGQVLSPVSPDRRFGDDEMRRYASIGHLSANDRKIDLSAKCMSANGAKLRHGLSSDIGFDVAQCDAMRRFTTGNSCRSTRRAQFKQEASGEVGDLKVRAAVAKGKAPARASTRIDVRLIADVLFARRWHEPERGLGSCDCRP